MDSICILVKSFCLLFWVNGIEEQSSMSSINFLLSKVSMERVSMSEFCIERNILSM